jgi:hypothetical protein
MKHLFYNKKEHLYWFATPGEAARAGGYVKSNGPEEEDDTEPGGEDAYEDEE